MTIKRSSWEADREVENLAMANCLMLLSRVGQSDSLPGRVFHCKTCNKEFKIKSFQALGGHRASHKRAKVAVDGSELSASSASSSPRTHECSVCGLEFALGQALGGHMRRHRDGEGRREEAARREPVVVESKRGFGVDLNLTPYENDVKLWSRGGVNTALAI